MELTRQACWHVDLCVEPLVGQQLWHSIQGFYSKCVIGVGKKIDHSHSSFCQANLLRHKSNASPTWLTLPPDALPASHTVGQIHPAPCVGRSSPVQDQRGLLQSIGQVSGRGWGTYERKKKKKDNYLDLLVIPGRSWAVCKKIQCVLNLNELSCNLIYNSPEALWWV